MAKGNMSGGKSGRGFSLSELATYLIALILCLCPVVCGFLCVVGFSNASARTSEYFWAETEEQFSSDEYAEMIALLKEKGVDETYKAYQGRTTMSNKSLKKALNAAAATSDFFIGVMEYRWALLIATAVSIVLIAYLCAVNAFHCRALFVKTALFLFFAALAVFILVPLYALLLGTFKGGAELFISGLNLSINMDELHLLSWRYLFTSVKDDGIYSAHNYFLWYFNSLKVVAMQGVLTLLTSSFVAYGFAMYKFKGKNALFMCVLVMLMIPFEIIMLPMYTQVNAMGMLGSYSAIIVPFICNMSAIFFFRQFLSGVPIDLVDAGRVDGSTEYGIFFRIIVPIMKPAYASMAVMVCMGSWNNLLWPTLVINNMSKYTIPIGLNTLWSPYGNNYDLMITGSCFAIVPLLIMFLLAQRFIIDGMTAGSVKG